MVQSTIRGTEDPKTRVRTLPSSWASSGHVLVTTRSIMMWVPATPMLTVTFATRLPRSSGLAQMPGHCRDKRRMQLPSFVRAVLIELPSQRLSTTIYDSKRGRPVFEPCLGQAASKGHVTARSMSMHLLRFPMPYANLQLESFSRLGESTRAKKLRLLDWHKWTKGECSFLLSESRSAQF